MVRNEAIRAIGGSALTDEEIDVPEAENVAKTFRSLMYLSETRISSL